MNDFAIVAHRFSTDHFPENTLDALQRAAEMGADALHLDVQLTRDLIPVVHHSFYLVNTEQPQRLVFEVTSDELKQMSLRNQHGDVMGDHHIHRLYEVLGTLGRKTHFEIDLKSPQPEGIGILCDLLRDFRYLWHTFDIISVEPLILRAIQEQCPELRTKLMLPRGEANLGAEALAYYAWQRARLANVTMVYLHPAQVSAPVVELLRNQQIEVHAYDVNRTFEIQLMAQLGIPRFSTDQLKLALTYRRQGA